MARAFDDIPMSASGHMRAQKILEDVQRAAVEKQFKAKNTGLPKVEDKP